MTRQRKRCLAGLLILILLLAGCKGKEEPMKKPPYLYYENADGTGLTMVEYTMKEESAEAEVETMRKKLIKNPDSIEMKSVVPKDVNIEQATLEKGILHLYMNGAYHQMDEVQEVLLRAALVQSFIQIEGVDGVEFYVENKPLTSKNGEKVGIMDESSFVRNTGTAFKSFQKTTLTLFFPNQKGDKLVSEKREVHYFSNVPTEKLVLEQLMKAPESAGMKEALPSSVRILNTSIKDGICYVNFGKEFLSYAYDAGPECVIYGIVNSIVSNCDVSRVQLAVEGDSTVKFMEKISFEEPFERNIELVENE